MYSKFLHWLLLGTFAWCLWVICASATDTLSQSRAEPSADLWLLEQSSLQPPLEQHNRIFKKVRETYLCLKNKLFLFKVACLRKNSSKAQKALCSQEAQQYAWDKCFDRLQQAQKYLEEGRIQKKLSPVIKLQYQLQLSYLWLYYHWSNAGVPSLPSRQDFFLRSANQYKKLQHYSKAYQNHLQHMQKSLAYLKRFYDITLLLHKRSGWHNALRLLRLQMQITLLSTRITQGYLNLAFIHGSLAAFVDRSKQQKLNQSIQRHLQQTDQQLRSLHQQLRQIQQLLQRTQQRLKKGKTEASSRSAQMQELRDLQEQLRQQIQSIQKKIQEQKSKTPRDEKIKRIYLQLQRESRQSRLIMASDSLQRFQQWQQCESRIQRDLQHQSRAAQGMLWAGVSTALLGAGGLGVGTFFYVDSLNKDKHRPAQASYYQTVGTGLLIGGSVAAAVGSILILSHFWIRPGTHALKQSILTCPPQHLLPPNFAISSAIRMSYMLPLPSGQKATGDVVLLRLGP